MKRFHVHVAVNDLAQSTRFYSALFGADPTVVKPDYAKWMLDDPRINFAISQRDARRGINHLGFQVDSPDELEALQQQHQAADLAVFAEGNTRCCYAESRKHWVTDPQGVAWEMYHSMAQVETWNGNGADAAVPATAGSCCAPSGGSTMTSAQAVNAAAGAVLSTDTKPAQAAGVASGCSTSCCPSPVAA